MLTLHAVFHKIQKTEAFLIYLFETNFILNTKIKDITNEYYKLISLMHTKIVGKVLANLIHQLIKRVIHMMK
jgi:hypothetical protein